MGKLAVGNSLISIETATKQVRRNIKELMGKRAQVIQGEGIATEAQAFYEKHIAAQKALLIWLQKAVK